MVDKAYEEFLERVANPDLSDLDRTRIIICHTTGKIGRGLAHSELAELGILIDKKTLVRLVEGGFLNMQKTEEGEFLYTTPERICQMLGEYTNGK